MNIALDVFADRVAAGELGPRERAALADLVIVAADAVTDPAGTWEPVQRQMWELLRMAGS